MPQKKDDSKKKTVKKKAKPKIDKEIRVAQSVKTRVQVKDDTIQALIDKFDGSKKRMLKALYDQGGNITRASLACGVHRSSHYLWCQPSDRQYDETYARASKVCMDLGGERRLDMAEHVLDDLITNGRNVTATIFFLKTKGKNRGYIEELKQVHTTGQIVDREIPLKELAKELLIDD